MKRGAGGLGYLACWGGWGGGSLLQAEWNNSGTKIDSLRFADGTSRNRHLTQSSWSTVRLRQRAFWVPRLIPQKLKIWEPKIVKCIEGPSKGQQFLSVKQFFIQLWKFLKICLWIKRGGEDRYYPVPKIVLLKEIAVVLRGPRCTVQFWAPKFSANKKTF